MTRILVFLLVLFLLIGCKHIDGHRSEKVKVIDATVYFLILFDDEKEGR